MKRGRKMRKYIAFYDDGHDYGEFEFYSSNRANSKANKEDAKNTAYRLFGYNRALNIRIENTQLKTAY